MQQLEQDALLEQMLVVGALFSKASSWSKPVEVAGRTAEEVLSVGCMKGATVDWRCCFGIDNALASRRIASRCA